MAESPSKFELLKQAEVGIAVLLSQYCIAFFFLLSSLNARGSATCFWLWLGFSVVLGWHGWKLPSGLPCPGCTWKDPLPPSQRYYCLATAGTSSRSFSHGTVTSVLISGTWFPVTAYYTSGAVCWTPLTKLIFKPLRPILEHSFW